MTSIRWPVARSQTPPRVREERARYLPSSEMKGCVAGPSGLCGSDAVRRGTVSSWSFSRRILPSAFSVRDQPFHTDRKSTRLNSSHLGISYAVFCLKKKKKQQPNEHTWYNSITIDMPSSHLPPL